MSLVRLRVQQLPTARAQRGKLLHARWCAGTVVLPQFGAKGVHINYPDV
jgi:hypothetical protein